MAVSIVLGYGAWIVITRPLSRDGSAVRRVAPPNDSLAFVSVAAEGVDVEIVGPSGARTSTAGSPNAGRIPGSETVVDCPGFADARGKEVACTASITLSTPAEGEYTVVVRSTTPKWVTLNIGWATASGLKQGGFDVQMQIAPGGATGFQLAVVRDAVSQRSEPRPLKP